MKIMITLVYLLLAFGVGSIGIFADYGLQYDYYHDTCPQAEALISKLMADIIQKDSRVPPRMVRMHFHDCFVRVSIITTIYSLITDHLMIPSQMLFLFLSNLYICMCAKLFLLHVTGMRWICFVEFDPRQYCRERCTTQQPKLTRFRSDRPAQGGSRISVLGDCFLCRYTSICC